MSVLLSGALLPCALYGILRFHVLTAGAVGERFSSDMLLGFGAFIWFTETGIVSPSLSGGMFFVFLGLGFLASYAIAGRPQAIPSRRELLAVALIRGRNKISAL